MPVMRLMQIACKRVAVLFCVMQRGSFDSSDVRYRAYILICPDQSLAQFHPPFRLNLQYSNNKSLIRFNSLGLSIFPLEPTIFLSI